MASASAIIADIDEIMKGHGFAPAVYPRMYECLLSHEIEMYAAAERTPNDTRNLFHVAPYPRDEVADATHLTKLTMLEFHMRETDPVDAAKFTAEMVVRKLTGKTDATVRTANYTTILDEEPTQESDAPKSDPWAAAAAELDDDLQRRHRNHLLDEVRVDRWLERQRKAVGEFIVVTGMPPEIVAPAQADDDSRCEIYYVDDTVGVLELANIYNQNMDDDDRARRRWPSRAPSFRAVDIGVGIERCLMLRDGIGDIQDLAHIARDYPCNYLVEDEAGAQELVDVAREVMVGASGWWIADVDFDRLLERVQYFLTTNEGFAYYTPGGFVICYEAPSIFDTSTIAHEIALRTASGHGKVVSRLRKSAHAKAMERGCAHYMAYDTEQCRPDLLPDEIRRRQTARAFTHIAHCHLWEQVP